MKLRDFVEKLRWFNQDANVFINGVPLKDSHIAFGGPDGVQPYTCDIVNIVVNRYQVSSDIIQFETTAFASPKSLNDFNHDTPSFLNGNKED